MATSDRSGLKYTLFPGGSDTKFGKQYFAHGQFEWIRLPDERTPDGVMVAKCIIDPGKEWPEHNHGGYEQVLFVVSGDGVHWINGERREIFPGSVEFLPVNAVHRVVNTGIAPLIHVSVYHPIMPREVRDLALSVVDRPAGEHDQDLDPAEFLPASTIQSIQDKFAAAVGLGVVTVDSTGKPLTTPTGLPEFCRYMRSGRSHLPLCTAFGREAGQEAFASGHPTVINCCMGVVCVAVPLKAGDKLAGHMACGFVKLEEPGESHAGELLAIAKSRGLDACRLKESYDKIEVVLKAQMVAAADSLESIANSIVAFSMRETQRRRESEHRAEMLTKLQVVSRLEHELQESEFRALEARVNPHFLFNALNTIASAVAEGDPGSEDMVYALSDFLRFALRNTKSTTPLQEELTCLRNYLRIQNARFGSGLETRISVDPPLANPLVPSMILQPLVENAIAHGLASRGYVGRVLVCARQSAGRLSLVVSDDGVGFGEDLIVDLPRPDWLEKGPGMGLRYVRTKLRHTFGDDYSFAVESRPGWGTVITMEMPARDGDSR